MAGSNKVLKENQVLFRAGDKSDGMYLIRRGELRVYVEQDGKEVQLATIGEGGMIGEMALFDNQPRSASVKAAKECEVTLISTEDFGKLMKQIPKWFVGLMSALSSRLRQTNDRLKKLESAMGGAGAGSGAGPKGKPFQNVLRQLNVIILLWHKDGEKDGKDWVLQKTPMEKALTELFNEDPEKVKMMLEVLVKQKMLTTRQDTYKNVVLSTSNRGVLNGIVTFINTFLKTNPPKPCLSDEILAMLRTFEQMTLAAPYDTSTVSIQDLVKEGKKAAANTANWEAEINKMSNIGEEVKVVKTSSGPGLRAAKKDVSAFVRNHELLAALYKSNLV